MIDTVLQLAATNATGVVNFTEAANSMATVLGILTTFGLMLLFVYKNRTLSLENQRSIARIESDFKERMTAMENAHKERASIFDAQRDAQQADLKRLEIELVKLKAGLGVNT